MSKKKEKKTGPTLKINPLRIADNYLKRPCLKNVADRINLIAKNAFREIAPKYNDSDFLAVSSSLFKVESISRNSSASLHSTVVMNQPIYMAAGRQRYTTEPCSICP